MLYGDIMPAVTRLGDKCTGHDSYIPEKSSEGSSNVFVNGIPVHRLHDAWIPHGCAPERFLEAGSPNVFVNGLPLGRIGDPITTDKENIDDKCSSVVAEGSPDVFAN